MHSFAACALLTLVTAHVARGALYNRTVLDGINWAWPANNKTNFASARPRIYVYELPAKFRQDDKFVEIAKGSDYSLDVLLPWMVKQSPYVTKNPEEADFFLVHAWLYWQRMEGSARDVRDLLKAAGPWWERKHGHDHIFVSTCDDGRGWYAQPELFNVTMLHHYGSVAGEEIQLLHHCNTRKRWGGECDWAMTIGLNAAKGKQAAPNHIPGRDIVLPPAGFEAREDTLPYVNPALMKDLEQKESILFYAGEINAHRRENRTDEPWSDAYYSMGGRQTVYAVVGEKDHYAIHTRHAWNNGAKSFDYFEGQRKSIFCLAAAGWGWGQRMKIGITHGCIPVIVQDGIRVEWEEHVPMKDYAIRIPIWMAHKMDEILKLFIRTGRTKRMQKVLECAWRLHWWRRPHGRAFEMLMCELKRRMLGEKGRVRVDWDACTVWCGDTKPVEIGREGLWHNV